MKLVDTLDLKSDSYKKNIGSNPIMSKKSFLAKMMELVDMLGLGSSFFKLRVQVPFLVVQLWFLF